MGYAAGYTSFLVVDPSHTHEQAPLVVEGLILFPSTVSFRDATVYIRLEDVTVADAAAQVIAEQRLQGIRSPLPGGGVRFLLRPSTIDERRDYSVRVHVDVDGDGVVSRGDLVTTRSYPVLTRGRPAHIEARVELV